jgi:hypothetical protein
MKQLFKTGSIALIALSAVANAQLYGVGHVSGNNTFYQIDTTTGAATALFSYGGGVNTNDLAYNPYTNKFVTAQTINSNSLAKRMIEIDAVALTATVVAEQVPTDFYEGLEYSISLGGLVVSYSPGLSASTTALALLDNSYKHRHRNRGYG